MPLFALPFGGRQGFGAKCGIGRKYGVDCGGGRMSAGLFDK
jgi:hypothetical protein